MEDDFRDQIRAKLEDQLKKELDELQMDLANIRQFTEDELKSLTDLTAEQLKTLVGDVSLTSALEKADQLVLGNYLELTADEKEALRKMGMSEADIASLDLRNNPQEALDKMAAQGQAYGDRRAKDATKIAEEELVPGLGAATLDLAFAAFLGIPVAVRCYRWPSAVLFSATAAYWVIKEMSIWGGYKEELAEIGKRDFGGEWEQALKDTTVDINALSAKIKELQQLQGEGIFEQSRDLTAKIKDLAEDLRLKLAKYRAIVESVGNDQLKYFEQVLEMYQLALDTTQKKADNALHAAIGFGSAAALAAAEAAGLYGADAGSCAPVAGVSSSNWSNYLIPQAVGGDVPLLSSINSDATIGDFDKIGIIGGATLGAAYAAFGLEFLDPIYRTGVSRAITFSIMAGIAYYAHAKLAAAVEKLQEIAEELKLFLKVVRARFERLDGITDNVDALIAWVEELLPKINQLIDILENTYLSAKEKVELVKAKLRELQDKWQGRLENLTMDDLGLNIGGLTKEQAQKIFDEIKEEYRKKYQDQIDQLQKDLQDAFDQIPVSKKEEERKNWMQPFWHLLEMDALAAAAPAKDVTGKGARKTMCWRQNRMVDSNCACLAKGDCYNISRALAKAGTGIPKTFPSFVGDYQKGLQWGFNGDHRQAYYQLQEVSKQRAIIDSTYESYLQKAQKTPAGQREGEKLKRDLEKKLALLHTQRSKNETSSSSSSPGLFNDLRKIEGTLPLPSPAPLGTSTTGIDQLRTWANLKKRLLIAKDGSTAREQGEILLFPEHADINQSQQDLFQIISHRYWQVFYP